MATQSDLGIEALLGARARGVLPREVLARLLHLLVDCPDVQLDGQAVTIGRPLCGVRAVVEDCAAGVRLRLEQDAAVRELFANGALLAEGALHALDDTGLAAREIDELRRGRVYAPSELHELASRVVPDLKRRLTVQVTSERLPGVHRVAPRLVLETARAGDALSVLATLVYGAPAVARVDGDALHALGGPLPERDLRAEQHQKARLLRELGLVVGERRELDAREAIAFAARLGTWQGEVRGAGHLQFFFAGRLTPRLALSGAAFELEFVAQADLAASSPDSPTTTQERGGQPPSARADAVLAAWGANTALVPLAGGGFAELPRDWLAAHARLVTDLLAARSAAGTLPTAALPDLGRLCTALGEPAPPALDALAPLLANFAGLRQAALPADLHAELRHYQQQGVDWLAFMREAKLGALLADDMGLGKTLETLCVLAGRTLVVAPTSVVPNWAQEIARFRPSLRVALYSGPGRALDPHAEVTLTSYALLRLDSEALGRVAWDTVVLDEAHAIKNPDSQVARAAYALTATHRIALSGTPVENRLDELWSQLHFLNRGLLGSRGDFQERYARPIEAGDEAALSHLRERTKPFILRRKKSVVAPELPPRTEVTLWAELSEPERATYDAVRAATADEVVKNLAAGASVMQVLEALLRLRQAACHPALVPGQKADSSAKIDLLTETLAEAVAEGHKALVFSQWTSLLDLVEPALRAEGLGFARLDGQTRDRGAVVADFQRDDGPPVLLISLKAGGAGLNLTAADHVFLLDPWWNPAVEEQAADRAHRIGQTRPVFVHRLVARDTVEERILALQEKKRALAGAALAEASGAAAITKDDLVALLA